MEKELNIVEILKNKPEGISLYSSVFGGCVYRGNCDNCIEVVTNNCYYFNEKGHYITNGVKSENGECLLFPSNEMRDWSKFAWKKGDVLVSEGMGRLHVIFEGFDDDTYLTFKGKHYLCNEEYNGYHKEIILRTIEFKKDNVNDAKAYINTIDEHLGGKFNLETLKIEKASPFANADECWQEMQKHQPFGWLKSKNDGYLTLITVVEDEDMMALNGITGWDFLSIMNMYVFADGTPFGVKIEKEQ